MKTLPTYSSLRAAYGPGGLFQEKGPHLKRISPIMAQTWELAAFRSLVEFVNARGEQFNQGLLFSCYTRYAFDPSNKLMSGWALDHFESCVGPHLPKWHDHFILVLP